LREVSSPDDVQILSETITETATIVQEEVDRLTDADVNKVILVSHLQSIDNDRALIGQLTNVDIAVAGGGDELLLNSSVDESEQLLPGEGADIEGEYPLEAQDADENTVYIVTTAGNYKYLGRLDVDFDENGVVTGIVSESSYPRPVIPESDAATELELTNAVASDPDIETSVVDPVNDCLALLNETPVVSSEVILDVSRDGVRGRETNSGNLITDSFLEAYDQNAEEFGFPARSAENPVIAIQNGGGIRQNAGDALPEGGAPGVITRRNTIDVLPFANFTTVISDVTPADLETIFERSVDFTESSGQFLQVAGMSVVYDLSQPVGSRVISLALADDTVIIEDGEVVEGAPTVTVVTNSFTAGGGDGYETLADNPNKTQLPLSYEQSWRNYLEAFDEVDGSPTIPADDERYQPGGEGRITFVQQLYLPFVAR
ncbi:MAG: 5'-nucleotidase C-terminal domain-containing protein, partial [Chloroflexota bacterium]